MELKLLQELQIIQILPEVSQKRIKILSGIAMLVIMKAGVDLLL